MPTSAGSSSFTDAFQLAGALAAAAGKDAPEVKGGRNAKAADGHDEDAKSQKTSGTGTKDQGSVTPVVIPAAALPVSQMILPLPVPAAALPVVSSGQGAQGGDGQASGLPVFTVNGNSGSAVIAAAGDQVGAGGYVPSSAQPTGSDSGSPLSGTQAGSDLAAPVSGQPAGTASVTPQAGSQTTSQASAPVAGAVSAAVTAGTMPSLQSVVQAGAAAAVPAPVPVSGAQVQTPLAKAAQPMTNSNGVTAAAQSKDDSKPALADLKRMLTPQGTAEVPSSPAPAKGADAGDGSAKAESTSAVAGASVDQPASKAAADTNDAASQAAAMAQTLAVPVTQTVPVTGQVGSSLGVATPGNGVNAGSKGSGVQTAVTDSTGRSAGVDGKGKRKADDAASQTSTGNAGFQDKLNQAIDRPVQQVAGHATASAAGMDRALQAAPARVSTDASSSGSAASDEAGSKLPVPTPASGAELNAMPAVNSAQLIQSMHHSEMRLGMQSAEFGNISINTSLNHSALSAQISIDHSELGRALAVHLPAIEEKLGAAYGVQARVEVRDSSTAPGNNPDQSASGQQQGSRGDRGGDRGGNNASSFFGSSSQTGALTSSISTAAVDSTRLDIRI